MRGESSGSLPRVLETVTRSLWLWGGERLAGETGEERRKFLCQSRLLGRVFSIRWFFFFLTYLLRIFTFPCAFIFYRKAFISNHLYVWLYIVHLYHTVSFNILLPFKWRNSILVSTFFVPTIFFFLTRENTFLKRICSLFLKKYLFVSLTASDLRWHHAGSFVVAHRLSGAAGRLSLVVVPEPKLLWGMQDLSSLTRN